MQAGSVQGNYIMSGMSACSVCWKDDFECDCDREWVEPFESEIEMSDQEEEDWAEVCYKGDVDCGEEIPRHSYWQHSPYGNYRLPCVVQRMPVSTGPMYRPPWDLPVWGQGEISDRSEQDNIVDTISVSTIATIEIHTSPFTLPILYTGQQ